MNFKFVVPRMKGDEETFNNLNESMKLINSPVIIMSVSNDNPKECHIWFKYNKCIEAIKEQGLADDDVIVFCHNDVVIKDNFFKEKIEMIFSETDVGLVGVIGTSELIESGCWWNADQNKLRGHILQGSKGTSDSFHLVKGSIGYFNDAIAVDGLILITTGKFLKESGIMFSSDYDNSHFYDLNFCLDFLLKGYNIAIADIMVYHQSQGSANNQEAWTKSRDIFINKCKTIGLEFPINKDSIKKWKDSNNILDKIKSKDIIEVTI